jgi:hypothetical protein
MTMVDTKFFMLTCLRITPNQLPCELRSDDGYAALWLTEAEVDYLRQAAPAHAAQQGE